MNKAITVSIVDDEADLREHIGGYLHAAGGFKCKSVYASAEEALQHLPQDKPDVVLMDLSMPGLNGLEATRHLRDDHPGVAVIMLSMHADHRFVVEALRAQALGEGRAVVWGASRSGA